MDNSEINALHSLYEEPNDDNEKIDWDNMEEKGRVEDNDDDNDAVYITVVQFSGMSDEEFLGKETDNNKKKEK